MKKSILIFVILLLTFEGYSQIPLDFQTPNLNLIPIKISKTETKYFDQLLYTHDKNEFSLYNLDGSLYKTIYMPPKPDTSCWIEVVDFVTTSLFDNDPSSIEYLVHYDPCDSNLSGAPWRVRIIREDGTILLDEPYASYFYCQVYNTEEGAKLMLMYFDGNSIPYQKKVFSLPGEFPTSVPNSSGFTNDFLTLYPNPNNGSFYIKVNSSQENSITFDLYTIDGRLINEFKSNNKLINISNNSLPEGIYILQSQSKNINYRNKVLIKK